MPHIPTIAEHGVRDSKDYGWARILVPNGTTRHIIVRQNAQLVKASSSPEIKERLRNAEADWVVGIPEEFSAVVQGEFKRDVEQVRISGAKLE